MSNSVIQAIEARSTANVYDPSRQISDTQIAELVRLATLAPTSFNLQNWRFIAVRTAEAKEGLRKVAWDQPKVTEASVTFIICGVLPDHNDMADRLAPAVNANIMPEDIVPGWTGAAKALYFEQPQRSRDEAIRTATLGAATLMFAASSLGLGSTPMIGFDPDGVATEFGLADNEIPALLVTVGYATDDNWAQKPRRPVAEVLNLV